MSQLDTLFAPEQVAVLGATDREGSVGRTIVENLDATFEGSILPINPNRDTVLGYECYPDVASAPFADLGVIVLPADAVLDAMRELADAGVKDVIVISAGFSETGSEGSSREQTLQRIAAEHEMRVIGPNSLGVLSTASGLNATFGPRYPDAGAISFLSQSGAFVTAVLDWAAETDLGFRHVVSLGNEAVMDETDLLEAWGQDPETDVIIGYLEGIDHGQGFIETARRVTQETPVLLVKAGRTEAGAKAASSHTGSIAGNEAAYEAGLSQGGVIRAGTVEELFDGARALAGLPALDRDGIAVITNAGGPGVMATDAIGDSPLDLTRFADETLDAYEDALPAGASAYNPVDILGDANEERFASAIEIALDDPQVGGVIVVAAPTGVLSFEGLAKEIQDVTAGADKPVVTSLMGGATARQAADALASRGIPNYFDPARAVSGLATLSRQRTVATRTYDDPAKFDVDRSRADEYIGEAIARGRARLGVEAMDLLSAYGIPTPTGEVARDQEAAEAVAADIDDPVAMKIVSPDISHKTDIGGVALDVDPTDVAETYERLVTNARQYQADATITGVQVQEMVDLEDGTETIVGANRDPQFGPMVLFGLGGIFVETLEDTTVRIAPITGEEAREMVEGIRAAPLLRGARGRPPADVDAIAEVLQRLSQLMMDHPEILELDVNPLVAGPDGVLAVDFRATLDTEES